MKKGTIIAIIVGVVMVLGVILAVQYSNKSDEKVTETGSATGANRVCTVKGSTYDASDDTNPAAKVGANITRLTCESFKDNVDNAKGIVVVDMYLPGCPHCQKAGPVLEEIANENVGKFKVAKIDVGKYSSIGTEFNIESVPAFVIFKDGKLVKTVVGEKSKAELLSAIQEAQSS